MKYFPLNYFFSLIITAIIYFLTYCLAIAADKIQLGFYDFFYLSIIVVFVSAIVPALVLGTLSIYDRKYKNILHKFFNISSLGIILLFFA